jgi:hypothetical protein
VESRRVPDCGPSSFRSPVLFESHRSWTTPTPAAIARKQLRLTEFGTKIVEVSNLKTMPPPTTAVEVILAFKSKSHFSCWLEDFLTRLTTTTSVLIFRVMQ